VSRATRKAKSAWQYSGSNSRSLDGWKGARFDIRWQMHDADSLHRFAKELVGLQPDVILSESTPPTAALLQQTRTIPIVFAVVSDPIGSGFVANLARPGGNVTGFLNIEGSLGGKWMELLKEIAPRVLPLTGSLGARRQTRR
jgi:putative tryptophan/tyrosine transport system substrate-binding protein